LLVVDGHNSHYTAEFLNYARENQIIVICYPVHAMHIYQGLDVVVFSSLKHHLSKERDRHFYHTGEPITKSNFLQILDKAWQAALTPEIIKTAFQKTGLHPFDPSVIKPEMFAPSKDTSIEAHLPSLPSSSALNPELPLNAIVGMFWKFQVAPNPADTSSSNSNISLPANNQCGAQQEEETAITISGNRQTFRCVTRSSINQSASLEMSTITSTTSTTTTATSAPAIDNPTVQIVLETVAELQASSLHHLVTSMPTTSSDPAPPQHFRTQHNLAKDLVHAHAAAHMIKPQTTNEVILLAALQEAEAHVQHIEAHAFELQASNILNAAYTSRMKL